MFIYYGCDNLKHFFSDFIGCSGIQPVIKLVFENVQVSSTFDFIWNIIPHIDNSFSKKFLRISVCTTQVTSDSKDHWTFWFVFHFHQVHRLSQTICFYPHDSCPCRIFQTWIISPLFLLFSRLVSPTSLSFSS